MYIISVFHSHSLSLHARAFLVYATLMNKQDWYSTFLLRLRQFHITVGFLPYPSLSPLSLRLFNFFYPLCSHHALLLLFNVSVFSMTKHITFHPSPLSSILLLYFPDIVLYYSWFFLSAAPPTDHLVRLFSFSSCSHNFFSSSVYSASFFMLDRKCWSTVRKNNQSSSSHST